MVRGDHVGGLDGPARADGRGLLTGRQVDEPGDLAVAVEVGHAPFETPDQQHAAVHLEEIGARVVERQRLGRIHGCVVYWSVGTVSHMGSRAMSQQIEIPDSFPGVGDVSGRRVVLTGASRGLGELIAHAFSRGGAKVALVARTERDLKMVADALPGPTLQFSGDVRDAEFNEAVAEGTVSAWGGVDVWICNAGISPIVAGPLGTAPHVWREVIDGNLPGAFFGDCAPPR